MSSSGFNFNYNQTPTGTLQSQGMFYQPPMPNMGTPRGTGVADGRAYTRSVQGDELVANQMNNLENQNSQYMQNARRRGLETANSRGMLNSSIAAGSSQRSALEAAMPIAQADAASFGRAASENLGYMNDNLMQEREIANRILMEREGLANSRYNADLAAGTQRYGIDVGLLGDREQRAYGGEQQGLDRAFQYGMSNLGQQQELERMGYGNMYDQSNMFLGNRLGQSDMLLGNRLGQSDMRLGANLQEWQAGNNWGRDMMGNIINTHTGGRQALNMNLMAMMQESPDVYTPEVVQALSGFMGQAGDAVFNDIMNQIGPLIAGFLGGRGG